MKEEYMNDCGSKTGKTEGICHCKEGTEIKTALVLIGIHINVEI